MSRKVNIGLIQLACSTNISDNKVRTNEAIVKAAKQGANIICLQELYQSQYFCFNEDAAAYELAINIDKDLDDLKKLSEKYNIVIVASIFERRTAGIYHNTAVVFDAGGTMLGYYRKNHIPDDPGYYEKYYFTPGDTGYKVFDTKFGKIGVLVCWDQWYPEAARITALKGAEIIFYPTAIGWDLNESSDEVNQEQRNAWISIQQSHAIANGLYVASVNRVGTENGQQFWGSTFIANPFGSIIKQASTDKEEILVETIDLDKIETYRQTWPFLRDRRIDTFQPILNRFIDND